MLTVHRLIRLADLLPLPGCRLTAASVSFQARAASGIKGLFHRNPKQSSLDSHAAVQQGRKHPFGAHLLRRTASAPTRGQPKVLKGFPEMDTKDYSSEGASEERDSEDKASATASFQFTPPRHHNGESLSPPRRKGSWEHPDSNGAFCPEGGKGKSSLPDHRRPMSEPLKRASRLRFHEPPDMKPGVFARVALNSSGRVGVSSNCITCMIGSEESPETERRGQSEEGREGESKVSEQEVPEMNKPTPPPKRSDCLEPATMPHPPSAQAGVQQSLPKAKSYLEEQRPFSPHALLRSMPLPRSKARQTLGPQHLRPQPDSLKSSIRSCSVPRRRSPNAVMPAPSLPPDCKSSLGWQQPPPPTYGAVSSAPSAVKVNDAVALSDSSSCDSFGSLSSLDSPPMLPPRSVLDSRRRAAGTLQREMNALYAQKLEELRHMSPMFFAGKTSVSPSV